MRAAPHLMSDPNLNPMFSRRWTDPPDPKRERRPAGNGTAALIPSNLSTADNSETTLRAQAARWLARRHFLRLSVATVLAAEIGLGGGQ